MSPARHRTLVASAALAALLGSATPALADPAPAPAPALTRAPIAPSEPETDAPHSAPAGPHGGVMHGTSSNWSGYAATGAKFTAVSASWIQPTVICTSTDRWSSFWVGLDGDGSRSVEQTGSEADCSSGSPVYYSWYEMYPAYPVSYREPVRAGDHFTASVTTNGSGSFTLKLSDITQGWTHSVSRTLRGAKLASAEVIAEAPSDFLGPLPLADFDTVSFTDATANGRPIGHFSPENITMLSHGTTLATTSALTGGNAFSVTWKHS
ncbi:G1 family glutamic endopeptidase [Kitasatospora sp. MAP5-34]|uniref:G1 family glutamic endopeptidase n=1 Tax=Kitasatospora sp. MAP5-34 TaxID=3035102 RepID=UPI002476E252|nr:G1 family glutamic endopeptidase [Kitasatospora sp. MAP5-34]MDH6575924.1 hypothetical protein [Kitasatospora sp. MAP5-34]